MAACDYLFVVSPLESEAEAYGDACGGRDAPDGRTGCTQRFVWLGTAGDEPSVEAGDSATPSDACTSGDFEACDAVAIDPATPATDRRSALLCGGRLPQAALPAISAAIEESGPGCALTYGQR